MVIFLDIHRQFYVIHNQGKVFMPIVRSMILDFMAKFTVKVDVNTGYKPKWARFRQKEHKPTVYHYEAHTVDLTEFRFSINTIRDFVEFLKERNVSPSVLKIKRYDPPETYDLGIGLNPEFTPRDYQVPQIRYLVDKPYPTKLLSMQTGKGKTFTSLAGIVELNERTLVFVLPKYVEKWVSDIKKNTSATDDDIFVLQGAASLIRFQEALAEAPEAVPNFIIAANKTFLLYLKNYEETSGGEGFKYPMIPQEMFEKLGAGILLIDEVHQHFAGCFKMSLYADVRTIIACSATLENNNPKIQLMYNTLFPLDHRAPPMEFDRYIDVYALAYSIKDNYKIRYKGFNGTYSHTEYEKSIMRNKTTLAGYLKMVNETVVNGYVNRREEGDKCLVFAATVKLCTIIRDHLRKEHPELLIRRFAQDDPMENILESDICVTTLLSGGTAIDVPGLITCVQTIAVDSVQANKQSLGRLRKIDGKETRFYYLYNRRNPAHVRYHKSRMVKWRPLVATYRNTAYPWPI